MPLADLEFVIFHDIQWSLNTSRIRAKLDLALGEVPDDRDFTLDLTVTSEVLKV